jgi:hypothetical protein
MGRTASALAKLLPKRQEWLLLLSIAIVPACHDHSTAITPFSSPVFSANLDCILHRAFSCSHSARSFLCLRLRALWSHHLPHHGASV